ncbi:MAG: hypothetical protein CL853_04740 [Crocinitomicaceae bacterium]|nr:hypothetical protein [Crocinitomicaceae bacterium]|tara:strand:+ start:213 stop:527 length:315 start_codon:yes stop_codon:yes gene_type:complete
MKKILTIIIAGGFMASCSLTTPVTATNNTIGSKTGTAEATCLFAFPMVGVGQGSILSSGLVLGGKDYTISQAAKNGGISKIATVDLKVQNFYLFTKNTIIVTGE